MKIVYGHLGRGIFWIRIWNGNGIKFKNIKRHPLLFSERNAHDFSRFYIRIGNLFIAHLKPNQP